MAIGRSIVGSSVSIVALGGRGSVPSAEGTLGWPEEALARLAWGVRLPARAKAARIATLKKARKRWCDSLVVDKGLLSLQLGKGRQAT